MSGNYICCIFIFTFFTNTYMISSISTKSKQFSHCCMVSSTFINLCSIIWFQNRLIGLVGRVFINGLGHLGSIPGRVIPKSLKMVLDTSLLNTQQYKVRINPGKGVAPSLTPQCSSYCKRSLLVISPGQKCLNHYKVLQTFD